MHSKSPPPSVSTRGRSKRTPLSSTRGRSKRSLMMLRASPLNVHEVSEVVWSAAKSRANEVHITEGLAPRSSEARHTAKVHAADSREVGRAAADAGEVGCAAGSHAAKVRAAWCRASVARFCARGTRLSMQLKPVSHGMLPNKCT